MNFKCLSKIRKHQANKLILSGPLKTFWQQVSSFKTRYVQNTVHSERNKLTLNSKKRNKSDLDFVNKASGQGKSQSKSADSPFLKTSNIHGDDGVLSSHGESGTKPKMLKNEKHFSNLTLLKMSS